MASLRQKYKLLKGLCGDGWAYTGPFFLILDPTRRCNLRCLGCRYHSPELENLPSAAETQDFPFEWVEGLFSEIAALGTREVRLVGDGEPLLHPRIFDIVRSAKQHGLKTSMTTNGTLLNNEKVREAVESGLNAMDVTLWAGSVETYERLYPGSDPENFFRITRALQALASLKAEKSTSMPRVMLRCPVNCLNWRDLEVMVSLAKQTGCDGISFTPFKTHRGQLSHFALSSAQQAELGMGLARLRGRIRALGLRHTLKDFHTRVVFDERGRRQPCYIGWFHARVKADGTVMPCNRSQFSLGNLRTSSFSEIWNGHAYRMHRTKMMAPDGHDYRETIADCQVCCFARDNRRIDGVFRFLRPFLALRVE